MSPTDWLEKDFDLNQPNSPNPWTVMSTTDVLRMQSDYNQFKYARSTFTFDIIIRIVVSMAGIVGHVCTLLVLAHKEFKTATSSIFLRLISWTDLFFCLSACLMSCMEFRCLDSSSRLAMLLWAHLIKNIRGVSGYFSDLLGVGLGVDRLAAIWFFYTYNKMNAKKKNNFVYVSIVSLFLLSSLCQAGWSLSVTVADSINARNVTRYGIAPLPFYLNGYGQMWEIVTTLYYEWFIVGLSFAISILIIVGMCRLNKRQMTKQSDKDQRKREFRSSYITLCLSVMLWAWGTCDFVEKTILKMFTFDNLESLKYESTYEDASEVIQALYVKALIAYGREWFWSLVHASNFYLYFLLHRRFRRVFLNIMKGKPNGNVTICVKPHASQLDVLPSGSNGNAAAFAQRVRMQAKRPSIVPREQIT